MGYEFGFVPLNDDVSASVNSVFGRTGAVAASVGDYTAAQVTNAADKSSGTTQAFTGSITANSASVSGPITGTAITGTTGTFSGNILANSASVPGSLSAASHLGGTAAFTGAITASSASVSGSLSAVTGAFTGAVSTTGLTGTTAIFTNALTANSASVSGGLSGSSLSISGTTGPQFNSLGLGIAAASVVGTFATVPPASASVQTQLGTNLQLGVAYQNTLLYDVRVTIFLSISVNTSGAISLGVGPTNTPTQRVIEGGVTTVGFLPITFKIPTNYYALLSIAGTVTDSIAGQYVEAA